MGVATHFPWTPERGIDFDILDPQVTAAINAWFLDGSVSYVLVVLPVDGLGPSASRSLTQPLGTADLRPGRDREWEASLVACGNARVGAALELAHLAQQAGAGWCIGTPGKSPLLPEAGLPNSIARSIELPNPSFASRCTILETIRNRNAVNSSSVFIN